MKHPRSSSSRLLRPSVLGTAAALLFTACNSGTSPRDTDPEGFPEVGDIRLQLTRATDCGDLLARIQDNVIAQLGERARQLRSEAAYESGPGFARGQGDVVTAPGNAVSDPSGAPPPAAPTPGPVAPQDDGMSAGNPGALPDANDDAPREESESPATGGGFSGTTVQVRDVDEADIVKTDGDLLYLLHGASLFIVRAWPAASSEVVASTVIEGDPVEMFVRDGRALVFSRVYRDLGAGAGSSRPGGDYEYYYGDSSYTKVTVLDVSGAEPSVARESYVEGDYISARRHDGIVRAIVQDGFKVPPLGSPAIQYRDPFGQPFPQADIDLQVDAWLERTIRSIRATDLSDWLPREYAASGSDLILQPPRCGDYYAPDVGLTESGVTSVVSLDLDAPGAPLGGATILGRAERVYSNEDVVLVTQSDYRFLWSAEGREQTIIHRFDIDGAATAYTASGAVAGSIHDQFSLDERSGIIRVSTTEQSFGRFMGGGTPSAEPAPSGGPIAVDAPAMMPAPEPVRPEGPVNRVVTLETNGRELVQLGSTEDFGFNEQIFSTRFIGDRGYVVTFRRTDPLFVVDLSDPSAPAVVGELHIPGFSDFLFPLGDDHLFAIGRDATLEGVVRGLALQIFDVSDPTAPALAHRHVFDDLGDSPANIDHRAINFHAERDVVAFPHYSWQTGASTLDVFQISADAGIRRLGAMGMPVDGDLRQCLQRFGYGQAEVSEILSQIESDPGLEREYLAMCSSGHQFRRGLFRDDVVYGISTNGIYAYDLDAMAAGAIGQVSLPDAQYNGDYGRGVAMPGIATPPPPTDPTIGAGGMMSVEPERADEPPEADGGEAEAQ